MLEIFLEEQPIELNESFGGLDLNLINPLFSDLNSHSFSFYTPKNPVILSIINYSVINNTYEYKKPYNMIIRFGSFRIQGIAYILNVEEEIEWYFVEDSTQLANKLKRKSLKDLTYSENIDRQDIDDASQTSTKPYSFFPMDITDEDLITADQDGDHIQRYIANYYSDNGILNGKFIPDHESSMHSTSQSVNNINRIHSFHNPFFRLHFVFDQIISALGLRAETNIFDTDSTLRQIVVIYLNPSDKVNNQGEMGTAYLKDYLPDMKFNEFNREIERLIGIKIIINTTNMDINIVNIIDLINASPADDLTHILESIYGFQPHESKNFNLKYSRDSEDSYLQESGQFEDHYYEEDPENAIEDYQVKLDSLPTINQGEYFYKETEPSTDYYEYYYRSWEIPKINVKFKFNTSQSFYIKLIPEKEQKLRLLFAKGSENESARKKYNSSDDTYTNETVDVYNAGRYKTPSLSFNWIDSGIGMFEEKLKPLLFWENNLKKILKAKINFDSGDLAKIDFKRTYTLDNYKCFISKIPITLKLNSIKIGECEVVAV